MEACGRHTLTRSAGRTLRCAKPAPDGVLDLSSVKQWRGRVEDAEQLAREFPALAGVLARPESRRHVLRLRAASMALGGLGGCDPSTPDSHYVPAVNQAEDIVPGLPNHYA